MSVTLTPHYLRRTTLANNLTIEGGESGTILNVTGPITGNSSLYIAYQTGILNLTSPANSFNGDLFVLGTGTVNLAGSVNAGSGGISQSAGTIRFTSGSSFGSGSIKLRGGILRADASTTLTQDFFIGNDHTIDTGANMLTLAGAIKGAQGTITKTGSGTLALDGTSNFTGTLATNAGRLLLRGRMNGVRAVTVASGAILELGASDLVNDSAAVSLTAASLATAGFSETVGALSLVAGASTLDLGSGASLFHFTDSSTQAWTGTLAITNWSGLQTGGGTDQLFFGTDATGLTTGQIDQITFLNPAGIPPGNWPAVLLSNGEIVAAPEPGTIALLLSSLSLIVAHRRRC